MPPPARSPHYGTRLRIGLLIPCRNTICEPDAAAILPDGISLSDDPLLGARSKTYSTSFTRRAHEAPGPSAAGQDLAAGSIR